MSFEEWKDMPRRLGWKHEYWAGYARLSPRHKLVYLRRVLYPQEAPPIPEIPDGYLLRAVKRTDAAGLQALYVASFGDAIEFFRWPQERVLKQARDDIRAYGGSRPHTRK